MTRFFLPWTYTQRVQRVNGAGPHELAFTMRMVCIGALTYYREEVEQIFSSFVPDLLCVKASRRSHGWLSMDRKVTYIQEEDETRLSGRE